MPQVSALFIYPIKSCRGSALSSSELDPHGLRYDRRWMIVSEQGDMITQRTCPRLTQIIPAMGENLLEIHHDNNMNPVIHIPASCWETGPSLTVRVWKHVGIGIDQGPEIQWWLSDILRIHVRLVYMPSSDIRLPSRMPADIATQVSYADSHPLLMTSEESLAELNRHRSSQEPVPMSRFRPNLVVKQTAGAWDEEVWRAFRINNATFYGVKPCTRCQVVQIDQQTGVRREKDPLQTLARIHGEGKHTVFGMNLIHAGPGVIRVGDEVTEILRGVRPAL